MSLLARNEKYVNVNKTTKLESFVDDNEINGRKIKASEAKMNKTDGAGAFADKTYVRTYAGILPMGLLQVLTL